MTAAALRAELVKELSLKAALLEMERIYLVLESELSLTSALVDQMLTVVEHDKHRAVSEALNQGTVDWDPGRR